MRKEKTPHGLSGASNTLPANQGTALMHQEFIMTPEAEASPESQRTIMTLPPEHLAMLRDDRWSWYRKVLQRCRYGILFDYA